MAEMNGNKLVTNAFGASSHVTTSRVLIMKRPIPRGRKSGASVPASVKVAADRAWADCALSDLVDWAGLGCDCSAKPLCR